MTKIVHETELKYTTIGLDGVTKQVDALIKLIDALPNSGKKSNDAIQGIINSLKSLSTNGLKKSLGSEDAKTGVKELEVQLNRLATISRAIELFKDSDLQKSKAQEKTLRDIEKAHKALLKTSQIKEGTLGLGAATATEARAAEATLKAHLARKTQMLKDAQNEQRRIIYQDKKDVDKFDPKAGGFVRVNPKTNIVSNSAERLAELKVLKTQLVAESRVLQQNLERLAQEQLRTIQQKQLAIQQKNQLAGNTLNAEGTRAAQYQQIKNQEKGDYLREWSERQAELKRRAISEARQTQEYKNKAELEALNQNGARQAEIRRRAIEEKRQTDEATARAKMQQLNEAGQRSSQYQQIKNQEKGNYLKDWTERQEELKRRAISEARQVQEFKAKAELESLNQTGARQAELRRRAIEQKRQTEEAETRAKAQQLNESGYRSAEYRKLVNQERGNLFQQVQERQMFLRNNSLQSIYTQNNFSVPSVRDDITANTRVRDLTAQIVMENKKLLELKRAGQLSASEEAKILERVRNLSTQRSQEQHSQNMLNRASGERGASLLAVQAALMANYSIINTITGSIQAAVTTSIELEAAFRNVQAVTATTNTEMRVLEGTIKTVAASSKFSSLEVANAALTLGQAGLSAKQVGEALGSVVMLASAAGTNIAQAVDLVTSIIGVFDKRSTDVADIANKVTQASNASKVSVEKLALGFQYAGNTAAQMGITFEETTAAMAAMSNAGIKNGSTMGTGLRSFLTELQKPSEQFVETLRRIGLSVGDLDVKTYGLIGVTKRLREAGFTAGDAMKSFDIRSASAFNAMVGNPEEMERQYRLLLQTTAGVEANEIQMDSLKSQSARLTTSLGNLASAGFEPLSKILATLAGGFATVTQFMSENRVMMGVLGTATAALIAGGFAGYLGSVLVGLKGLLPTLSLATLSVSGLSTAFTGLSFAMGFGLVVAGLTAAFAAFQFITGSAAAELDRLKAAASEAKGSLEENSGTISSLEKKIESLTYRQSVLTDGSEDLKTASMEVTSQFGHLGYQADLNNETFETMIGKLKNLKGAMEEVRRQKLLDANQTNAELLKKQTEGLQDSVDRFTGKNKGEWDTTRSLDALLSKKDSPFSKEDTKVLRAALTELKRGDLTNMPNIGSASGIMSRVAGDSKNKDYPDLAYLEQTSKKFTEIAKQSLAVNTTRTIQAQLDDAANKAQAWRDFNTSGQFGTSKNGTLMTWEEYRDSQIKPGALVNKALESTNVRNADGKVNQAALFEEMKGLFKAGETFYKKELERANSLKDPLAAAALRSKSNDGLENLKTELIQQANVTQSGASRAYGDANDLQNLKQKKARQSGDKAAQIAAIKEKARLEIEYKTRAKFDENEIYEIQRGIERNRDQEIENVQGKFSGSNPTLKEAGRVKLAQATAAERQSQAAMDSSKSVASMAELDKALDLAIAKQLEAKQFRLEAAAAKHEASKGPGYDEELGKLNLAEEEAAIEDSTKAKLESLRNNFISLYEAAAKRLDKTGKLIQETTARIADMKLKGEDRVFEAQQVSRDLDLDVKYNIYSDVSLSVRRRNQASLDALKIELEENQKLLDAFGTESVGQLANMRKAFEEADLRLEGTRKALATAAPGEREKLTGVLAVDQKERDAAFGAYREGKQARNRLRSDNVTLTTNYREAQQNFPADQDDPESYSRKLDQVFGNFKSHVAEMNIVSTMGKGLQDTLGGVTNSIADMFAQVVSGTMSTKDAFKAMAGSVIKSILGIITQMIAMKIVQAGLSMFGGGNVSLPASSLPSIAIPAPVGLATGGYVNSRGVIERVRKMASGGPITGGIRGKDSVPVLAMPGEFMLNKRAVDAVGTDFLHNLNATSNSVVSESQARPTTPNQAGGIVNVYVVSPDQKPSGMGPKDVIVAVSDDIMRGGSVKQLIKQVQMGQV